MNIRDPIMHTGAILTVSGVIGVVLNEILMLDYFSALYSIALVGYIILIISIIFPSNNNNKVSK